MRQFGDFKKSDPQSVHVRKFRQIHTVRKSIHKRQPESFLHTSAAYSPSRELAIWRDGPTFIYPIHPFIVGVMPAPILMHS